VLCEAPYKAFSDDTWRSALMENFNITVFFTHGVIINPFFNDCSIEK
jgi:hypothetical protein